MFGVEVYCKAFIDQEKRRLVIINNFSYHGFCFCTLGVEFAAELADFVRHDLENLYPELHDKIQITLVDGYNKILSTYDEEVGVCYIVTLAYKITKLTSIFHSIG